METTPFSGARQKLTIASLDDSKIAVPAQFNPKELQVTQPIGWAEHASVHNSSPDDTVMEFGGMKPQTMQIELLFDGAESGGIVCSPTDTGKSSEQSVTDLIAKLKTLASVRDRNSHDEDYLRPHYCVVVWGDRGVPRFRCVIESITTKYTMFSSDGVVLRAVCTVNLKEADRVSMTKLRRQQEQWAGRLR
jgi:hypothetical protein